jgi:hypothetical protein
MTALFYSIWNKQNYSTERRKEHLAWNTSLDKQIKATSSHSLAAQSSPDQSSKFQPSQVQPLQNQPPYTLEQRKCVGGWLTATAEVSRESIDRQDKQPLRLLQHLLTQVAELHSERYGEFLSQHGSAKIEKWLSGFIREETWNACKRGVYTLERCVRRDFEVCLLYILT